MLVDVDMMSFNSRTREGCDKEDECQVLAFRGFNSRTREGCDLPRGRCPQLFWTVSIHAPGRGATRSAPSNSCYHLGFNSRTREGCDRSRCLLTLRILGSLHAPGRGATINVDKSTTDLQFQFTHPGGVRLLRVRQQRVLSKSFNSRTREGCDQNHQCYILYTLGFNSRTREGCDSELFGTENLVAKFQFTHPGGVRLPGRPQLLIRHEVSIHAPGRGATQALSPRSSSVLFQFTHPGGVRQ